MSDPSSRIDPFGYLMASDAFEGISDTVSISLDPILAAFVDNISRTRQLLILPIAILAGSQLHTAVQTKAAMKLGIDPTDARFTNFDFDEETGDNIRNLSQKYLDAWRYHGGTQSGAMEIGRANYSTMLGGAAMDQVRPGVEATFAAVLISAWTAIEALIGDLWETALNISPEKLGGLSGGKKGAGDLDKSIGIEVIRMYRFDLSEKMGTILRDKFRFSVLESARDAYRRAFSCDGNDVFSAIEHQSFDALSSVRHVLVHRAGKIDKEFIRSQSGSDLWPEDSLQVGHNIPLDGKIVHRLITSAVPQALALLHAVDKWLATHAVRQVPIPQEGNGSPE